VDNKVWPPILADVVEDWDERIRARARLRRFQRAMEAMERLNREMSRSHEGMPTAEGDFSGTKKRRKDDDDKDKKDNARSRRHDSLM
jgi:sugar phosphate isomerase/epimerase